ncbi:Uncharacterised protein [Bordetella pertussis]|nr:Uncharacterised protein [Bordetella pertussis]
MRASSATRQDRDPQPQGDALRHAARHPQAGEPARPLAEGDRLQGFRRQAGACQQFPCHGQQAFCMLLGALVLQHGDDGFGPVLGEQGHAAAGRRSFEGKQV